tara:strand:+ start:785 stop:1327 length:543 start_codon:yes stop_codon:yes gene_type:complete
VYKKLFLILFSIHFLLGKNQNIQQNKDLDVFNNLESRIKNNSYVLTALIKPTIEDFDINSSEDLPILVESASSVLEQLNILKRLIQNIKYAYQVSEQLDVNDNQTLSFLNKQVKYINSNMKMYGGFNKIFLSLKKHDGFKNLIDINNDCSDLSKAAHLITINMINNLKCERKSFIKEKII